MEVVPDNIGKMPLGGAADARLFVWDIVVDSRDYSVMTSAYGRRLRQRRKPLSNAMLALLWIGLAAIAFAFFWTGRVYLQPSVLAFVLGAWTTLLCIWLYNRLIYPRTAGRLNALEGKTINTSFDVAGIRTSTDTTSTSFSWAAIEWVDETDTHFFLWPSSLVVLLLPKRVFRNADEGQQFAEALKDWTGGK